MKCYLASGWFDEIQEAARQTVLTELKKAEIEVYSPKEDGLFTPDQDPEDVFQENLNKIKECDFVVASTQGKDMGTIFECGFAYSYGVPIVYFWHNGYGKFNLMLSQSANIVTTNSGSLFEAFKEITRLGFVPRIPYKGDIE